MVKLKAFTLFDSLIAVTITAILVGAISLSFGYLVDSERPLAFYKAKEDINKLHHDLLKSKAYLSKTIDEEVYTINQNVTPYQGRQDLWLVEYTITMGSKIIYTDKRLVLNAED